MHIYFMYIHSKVSILPSRKTNSSSTQYGSIVLLKKPAEYNKLHHLSK